MRHGRAGLGRAVGGLLLALTLAGCAPAAAEGRIQLPPGFRIDVFASGVTGARFMTFTPQGVLLVSQTGRDQVVALPDPDHRGRAAAVRVVADGLNRPHGMAFYRGELHVADTDAVLNLGRLDENLRATQRRVVVPNLPHGGGHFTRTLGFGPDGKMYISVGSSCNVCEERDPRRAAILQFNPDGTGGRLFAAGLRNAVGFTWRPGTDEIWATENGRDWLGDDLPPDEINLVRDGGHYGWPYCYGKQIADPQYARGDFCQGTVPSAFDLQAHSAPLGLTFYGGSQFPAEYRGDLFVAFHGSWNRSVPTGYKVVRIRMRDGKPAGIEDFAVGWLVGGRPWGRPVDVAVGTDGNLFVSDDFGGQVFRITYAP